MSLLGFVVGLLIIGLLWWAVQRLIVAFHIGEPIATIIIVAFVVLVVLWLIGAVVGVPPHVRIW